MKRSQILKLALTKEIESLLKETENNRLPFNSAEVFVDNPNVEGVLKLTSLFLDGVVKATTVIPDEIEEIDPVEVLSLQVEEIEALLSEVYRQLGKPEPEAEWLRIPDNCVQNIWKNPEDPTETTEIAPTFYENNGTPGCEEGGDMTYSHTEILGSCLRSPGVTTIHTKGEDMDNQSSFLIGAVVGVFPESVIADLFSQWREEVEEPEADSEFVNWLCKDHGFQMADAPHEIVLE